MYEVSLARHEQLIRMSTVGAEPDCRSVMVASYNNKPCGDDGSRLADYRRTCHFWLPVPSRCRCQPWGKRPSRRGGGFSPRAPLPSSALKIRVWRYRSRKRDTGFCAIGPSVRKHWHADRLGCFQSILCSTRASAIRMSSRLRGRVD